MGHKVLDARLERWYKCSLCEQKYHGVVKCALGWACWKTYVGRPETNVARRLAMQQLGNGLYSAKQYEDAVSVKEAELAMMRRLGDTENNLLTAQSNLASAYHYLGRLEEALRMRQEVYSGSLKLNGEENSNTLMAANNYAHGLVSLQHYEEAKALLRKMMPVARRVLGDSIDLTLKLRWSYAMALYADPAATLDELREAVTTLEETERTARRVFGGAHPTAGSIAQSLRAVREARRAREPPNP